MRVEGRASPTKPELARQEPAQRQEKLDDHRLIEPIKGHDPLDVLLTEAVLRVAERVGDRVTGEHADDQERQDIGEEDNDDRLAYTREGKALVIAGHCEIQAV